MTKKCVLEEEKYVEALGQIIERDFFPDLPTLKKQTALIRDEEESVRWTNEKIHSAVTRETPLDRSNVSEWDQLIEQSVDNELKRDEENELVNGNVNTLMTLNHFVATHTSEDNESFNELQEKAVHDHRRRYHWAFDDKEEKGDPKLHLLANGTWISHEQRRIVDDVRAPKGPKDNRPSAPDTWKFCARNPLFLSPDLEATQDSCEIEASVKKIECSQTPWQSIPSVKPGMVRKTTVYANTRLIPEGAQLHESGSEQSVSSLRKDYPLVPMTPVIAPGVDASPLMTWGDIEGTPAILGATPTRISSTPSFELQDTSRREKLANRLESEARHRNISTRILRPTTPLRKRLKAVRTPISSSARSRISGVRSVLQNPLGSHTQLRASYSTPSRPPRHSSKARKIK